MKSAVLVLIVLAFVRPVFAEVIDVTNIKPEYYDKAPKKDLTDSAGRRVKIINTDSEKGTLVEVTENNAKVWRKHGIVYRFDKNKLSEMTTFSFGERNGLNEKYTDKGIVQFRRSYKNNLKHGKWEQYDDKGVLATACTYVDNLKQGKEYDYYNKKVSFERDFVDGLKDGEVLQYSNGKLVARSKFIKDKQIGKTQNY